MNGLVPGALVRCSSVIVWRPRAGIELSLDNMIVDKEWMGWAPEYLVGTVIAVIDGLVNVVIVLFNDGAWCTYFTSNLVEL